MSQKFNDQKAREAVPQNSDSWGITSSLLMEYEGNEIIRPCVHIMLGARCKNLNFVQDLLYLVFFHTDENG